MDELLGSDFGFSDIYSVFFRCLAFDLFVFDVDKKLSPDVLQH